MKIAIISTYPPRACGIATFTHNLAHAMQDSGAKLDIIALSDQSEKRYPSEVAYIIRQQELQDYHFAANFLNEHYDVCIIQHEYGIFGGECGQYIVSLAKDLQIPLVCNLHTVLDKPSLKEKEIILALSHYSSLLTVMTQHAIRLLEEVYGVCPRQTQLVPHGVPVFKENQEEAKRALGLVDKKIMLSFGFLGRSKGFETAIEAIPYIEDPNFVYIVLGTTHPNVRKHEGENYRKELENKAQQLGIQDKIIFVNQFADEDLLLRYLSACDIYVTPYPHIQQISSGTLSYAIGAGAAVLSTPYWYAKDLLADDRGILFDFKRSDQLAEKVNALLSQPLLLGAYRYRAKRYGEQMSWPNVGKKQVTLLYSLMLKHRSQLLEKGILKSSSGTFSHQLKWPIAQ
jgi:glycosyltransferase involved in cell wall biosynthesis